MNTQAFFSPTMDGWWYLVSDEAGDPLIVSPAMYETCGAALVAGTSQVATLAAIHARRVGSPLSLGAVHGR